MNDVFEVEKQRLSVPVRWENIGPTSPEDCLIVFPKPFQTDTLFDSIVPHCDISSTLRKSSETLISPHTGSCGIMMENWK